MLLGCIYSTAPSLTQSQGWQFDDLILSYQYLIDEQISECAESKVPMPFRDVSVNHSINHFNKPSVPPLNLKYWLPTVPEAFPQKFERQVNRT